MHLISWFCALKALPRDWGDVLIASVLLNPRTHTEIWVLFHTCNPNAPEGWWVETGGTLEAQWPVKIMPCANVPNQ